MLRLLAALALIAVAVPAGAQTAPASSPAPAAAPADSVVVDSALVGRWELVEVEDNGRMAVFGAEVQEMECTFESEGEAEVMMAVVQDRETIEADRSFRFETNDGWIVVNAAEPVAYEFVGPDEIRLTMPDGLIVRLRRTDDASADAEQG